MRVTDAVLVGTKEHTAHNGSTLHMEVQVSQLKQGLTTKSVVDLLILL